MLKNQLAIKWDEYRPVCVVSSQHDTTAAAALITNSYSQYYGITPNTYATFTLCMARGHCSCAATASDVLLHGATQMRGKLCKLYTNEFVSHATT